MANKAVGKSDKEEAKVRQAAEAAAKRSKRKQSSGEWKVYGAIASCVSFMLFGIYLAVSNPSGRGGKAGAANRNVNDGSFITDVANGASGNFTTAASPFFEDHQVENLMYGLGGITTSPYIGMPGAAQYCDSNDDMEGGALPAAFDARVKWEECVPAIRDSGNCSSSYAIAAAATLSARFCIADSSKYSKLNLAAQQILSCDSGSKGCKGGGVDAVWSYIEKRGLYPEDCLPYTAAGAAKTKCKTDCSDDKKHKIIKYCVLGNKKSLKREIQSRGPVMQSMFVMDDFLVYSGGIYYPTEQARPVFGKEGKQMLAAVVVHGWGIAEGKKYWIVANSWGTKWGEQGFARVSTDAHILDTNALVVTPATDEALAQVEKERVEAEKRKEELKKERIARDERIKEKQRLREQEAAEKRAAGGSVDDDDDLDDTKVEDLDGGEDAEDEVEL